MGSVLWEGMWGRVSQNTRRMLNMSCFCLITGVIVVIASLNTCTGGESNEQWIHNGCFVKTPIFFVLTFCTLARKLDSTIFLH